MIIQITARLFEAYMDTLPRHPDLLQINHPKGHTVSYVTQDAEHVYWLEIRDAVLQAAFYYPSYGPMASRTLRGELLLAIFAEVLMEALL